MEHVGPELNRKRIVSLAVAASVILTLFILKSAIYRNPGLEIEEERVASDSLVLSEFDDLFKEHSDSLLDWKLLAAIASVESEFDTTKVSPRGAFGLMQVMPATYRQMLLRIGIADSDSVSNWLNVYAAAQQLSDMNESFHFINPEERLNYILGSYNCGAGHVFDAMRIARENGVNRYLWSNVVEIMKTMNGEVEYPDSICRCGNFDATETISYVRKVRRRYREYCEMDTFDVER